jgi:hypothetical protein
MASWPGVLFLSTEPGTKGLQIHEVPIGDWATLLGAVDALEKDKSSKFKTIVIDTVDLAYDMCLEHVCTNLMIPYPGEDSSGKEDWGKSWKAVKDEFTDAVSRILRSNRGLWFVSHAKERQIKTRGGEKYDRIGPSMGSQASRVIEALVDIFIYADYMRDTDGNVVRVLVCEGDETVWAGHRKTAGKFPPLLPLEEKGGYETFVEAFNGEHEGIDPRTLASHRTTSPLLGKLVRGMGKEAEKTPKKTPKKKKTAKKRRR